jgi:hypothetical protein
MLYETIAELLCAKASVEEVANFGVIGVVVFVTL